METTIDAAGRVIIPKRLRDELGLAPGPVKVVRDGSAVRIEPVTNAKLSQVGKRLVISGSGNELTEDDVRDLRLADQK